MLENHKLLLDKDCPMCNIYGSFFEQTSLIDRNTLAHYQTIDDHVAARIDMDRARNEIALHDTVTGHNMYGLDSLITIVSHDRKWLKHLLANPWVYAFFKRLYKFITYNRKVIYPAPANTSGRACTPDLNLRYRWAYIILVALFTGLVLNQFAYGLNNALGYSHNHWREFVICFGQIIWQGAAVFFISRENLMDYLGNMSTVSLLGAVLLLPLLVIHAFIPLSAIALLAAFAWVVGLMLMEHIRRCRILGIPVSLTFSWVIYRNIVLAVILTSIFLS